MRETPWTVAESSALPPETKDAMLREAKMGTWYDGWQPYCMICGTMTRMHKEAYGFQCGCCGNMIAWDLTRLAESPLNRKKEIWEERMALQSYQRQESERQRKPQILLAGLGPEEDRIRELLGMADFPIIEVPHFPMHLGEPILLGIDMDRGYMKPAQQRIHSLIFEDDTPPPLTDKSWHHSLDDKDYSRMEHYPGPTGHPTRHRRQRKMRKASRQLNRRR